MLVVECYHRGASDDDAFAAVGRTAACCDRRAVFDERVDREGYRRRRNRVLEGAAACCDGDGQGEWLYIDVCLCVRRWGGGDELVVDRSHRCAIHSDPNGE
ncbi:MAG: hypothetical protein UY31_C0009G0010 [Candidatus Wolfebacteria bacterium GW2011_GWE1_48_7]|uniref:Uncharacterized protein n=1 Tax=Candidatus Wolfebacteria bacterium GW2011_GWA2_47_9b TaxID=1619005 RepID=A0A0G1X7Y1_9BACT|nr:MAG: hypothetical protein UX49_C0001G0056 [Candidatus Wolfebacteria bacterium GW2011_GWC2_46_275]KKU42654.1 MAG: hypothetical protein UX58_C0001G0086 [Candidatus Wolfebacteria bacterium GW2011_GWB2_46_69]KKU54611.1 MAG: hypothetical protein UX76_C0001G0070 [Candidatus Wolfebacteria bacterium GW2011_GWC1_47_103]KKU59995.1 MAG: hypothetical protein UX83_C0001G0070 [Candidatus Wolfebacteria bacterium GW2011_GWE2_47_12]KKU66403.1 MAG: hypothetical protein UX90_C0001G0462 [Candidatus Wolfebacteri